MDDQALIEWLLTGDASIQYQTRRDLLNINDTVLQARIATEGWGAQFLALRKPDGNWGRKFYQPKWTSTHYTLLDLKNLGLPQNHPAVQETIAMVLNTLKANDGGILPIGDIGKSDVCINGMFLNYASYFRAEEVDLHSVVDALLGEHMADGGFNCRSNRSGAVHSSLHTTLSVIEGIHSYAVNGYNYRLDELRSAESASQAFILEHRLYQSHRSGETIDPRFLRLSYPSRWRYDILRALDYFRLTGVKYDERMDDAMQVLLKKRRKDGTWPLQARHPGQTHFEMEKAGQTSRWNTLRALRVVRHFNI